MVRWTCFVDGQRSNLREYDGVARVVVPRAGWDEYLEVAVAERRVYGASAPQVMRRLRRMRHDLDAVAGGDERAAIRRQIDLQADGEPAPGLTRHRRFR